MESHPGSSRLMVPDLRFFNFTKVWKWSTLTIFCLKLGLTLLLSLTLNSLCSTGCPLTHISHLTLPSAGITGTYHNSWLRNYNLNFEFRSFVGLQSAVWYSCYSMLHLLISDEITDVKHQYSTVYYVDKLVYAVG
jgi:hypothetical protein